MGEEISEGVMIAREIAKIEQAIHFLAYARLGTPGGDRNFNTVRDNIREALNRDTFKKAWRRELAKAVEFTKGDVDVYTAWAKAEAAPLEDQIDIMIKYCKSGD